MSEHGVYRAECSCGWSIERSESAANLPEKNNREIVQKVAEIHEDRPRFGSDEEHSTTDPQRVMTDGGTAQSGDGASQVRRHLMSCPECGTVIERLYSGWKVEGGKDENCPNCEECKKFKHVMVVGE